MSTAKRGKDALAKELDDDLKTTSVDGASKALEPPGKAPRVEAAAAGPSISKRSSSFFKEFDKIWGGGVQQAALALLYYCMDILQRKDDPYKY